MNPFFDPPDGNPNEKIPPRTYGKIEHVELSDEGLHGLFAIDLIDADWFDKQDLDYLINFTSNVGNRK